LQVIDLTLGELYTGLFGIRDTCMTLNNTWWDKREVKPKNKMWQLKVFLNMLELLGTRALKSAEEVANYKEVMDNFDLL
jgi:hypothetical protein